MSVRIFAAVVTYSKWSYRGRDRCAVDRFVQRPRGNRRDVLDGENVNRRIGGAREIQKESEEEKVRNARDTQERKGRVLRQNDRRGCNSELPRCRGALRRDPARWRHSALAPIAPDRRDTHHHCIHAVNSLTSRHPFAAAAPPPSPPSNTHVPCRSG